MLKGKLFKINTLLPIILGLFLVYYSFKDTSVEERNIILESIINADFRFVIFSMLIGLFSNLVRAVRWQILIKPLGFNLKLTNSIMSIFAGLLSNFGIPRSGEFLRASLIHYYQKIPFEKNFGTIVVERIIDILLLTVLIFFGISSFAFLKIEQGFEVLNTFIYVIVFFCFSIFIIQRFKNNFNQRLQIFLINLREGIFSILKIEKKLIFIAHTTTIWICYFLMLYVAKFSLNETFFLPIESIFIAFIAGAISMALTNGGLGAYPLAISSVITQYGVSYENAITFGWVVWTSQTLVVVIFGCLSFIFLPILNKKKL
tara:strand:- start:6331 stop:7278 length:948 start_codon:yes stop_codon:yes gene_type:complete